AVVRNLVPGRQARLRVLAIVGRQEQRVVEVGRDPDVDVGVVEDGIEQQRVGIAGIGQLARGGGRVRDGQGECNAEQRSNQLFHVFLPVSPVLRAEVLCYS